MVYKWNHYLEFWKTSLTHFKNSKEYAFYVLTILNQVEHKLFT